MSITITTDVFCDICSRWIHGVVGPTSDARAARRVAKTNGWTRRLRNSKMIDVCPDCINKTERDYNEMDSS